MLEVAKNIFVDDEKIKGISQNKDKFFVFFTDNTMATITTSSITSTPIESAKMSRRAFNALKINGIKYLEQIPQNMKEISGMIGVGEKTAFELLSLARR